MDYIITWSNGFGKVSSGDYLFDVESAPTLPFAFDAIYYETPTGLSFKMLGGEQSPLTEEEIAACRAYCDGYLETGDYPVQAYETDSGLYRGTMLKSKAGEKGFSHILGDMPDHPVSKRVGDAWERVAAVIRSDGSYVLMPASVCDACVVFLTATEWEAHSKPSRSTERWDFATETWKDSRTVEQAKKSADAWIRGLYVAQRKELMGAAPYQELASWPWQIDEAKAWQSDNETETPFLDGVLEAMNADERTVTAKETLVQAVLKYTDAEWLKAVGKIHGEMYVQITKLRAAGTLEDIDALTDALAVAKQVSPITFALTFSTENGVVSSMSASTGRE
ncbi:hypothetical protein [Bilophila sp.]|uniref:hypothetical protein n=1 Tax=Bilophila sp. TaxID=1929485 RepID=UPI003077800C